MRQGLVGPYEGIEKGRAIKPQLEQLVDSGVVAGGIDALLISVGANDLGFSKVVTACAEANAKETLKQWATDSLREVLARLSQREGVCKFGEAGDIFRESIGKLAGKYALLDRRLDAVGIDPGDVFITEYFNPVRDDSGDFCAAALSHIIAREDLKWAERSVLRLLNKRVRLAAETYGWTFVTGIEQGLRRDSGGRGHGECANAHWIVQLPESFARQRDKNGTLHPNYQGHQCYGKRLAAAILRKDFDEDLPGRRC